MWELWSYKYGEWNTHLIGQYLNERYADEKTRWLPDLTKAQDVFPIHLCWGTEDDVAQKEIAEVLHKDVCPKAKLTWIPNAGHFLEQEKPLEVA